MVVPLFSSSNTSDTTYTNAIKLMEKLGVDLREINIHDDVVRQEELIGHDKTKKDTTYENIQARFRTYTLMNIANMEGGIVVGTSDMSEVALGWSTFNGDQMAMYGLNAGIPKTVVREMVRFYIDIYPELKECLLSVIGTPISPELAGSNQLTEDIIGKYEINDFILYHFLVNGDEAARIMFLIQKGFGLSEEDAFKYVDNFQKRFFSQQYKRITIPEGVKSISDEALAERERVLSVIIPQSVVEIGENAFADISNIEYHGTATGAPWGAKKIN